MIREDLPPPETPVTQVKVLNGIQAFTACRLLAVAPSTTSFLLFLNFRLESGIGIFKEPFKYLPVRLVVDCIIFCGDPEATICPPCVPAPGPISTTKSALRIASSSCSTTITVFPNSFRRLSVDNNLSLSL